MMLYKAVKEALVLPRASLATESGTNCGLVTEICIPNEARAPGLRTSRIDAQLNAFSTLITVCKSTV